VLQAEMQFRPHILIDIIRNPQSSFIKLRTSCNLDIRHLRAISASLAVLEHCTGQMSVNSLTSGPAPVRSTRSSTSQWPIPRSAHRPSRWTGVLCAARTG
jgi:hypothetical protein